MISDVQIDTNMNDFFFYCIDVLEWIGDTTGWGYRKANIYLFVIVHPLLTLAFFMGWKPKTKVMKIVKWSLFTIGVASLIILFTLFNIESIWSMNNRYEKILY